MSDLRFPASLKPIVSKGYSQTRGSNIWRSEVQGGLPRQGRDTYFEAVPISVTLVVSSLGRQAFYSFLNNISGGADSFVMAHDSGLGIQDHQVLITSTINDSTDDGKNWVLSFTATAERTAIQQDTCLTANLPDLFGCYGEGLRGFLNAYAVSQTTFPRIWDPYPPVDPRSPISLQSEDLDPRVTFSRAGTVSYVGANGLIQQAQANMWPLEYLGGVGRTEPEPASVNQLKFSATISNALWAANNSVKTAAQPSPDGGSNAVLWVPSAVNATHYLLQNNVPVIPMGSVISCFVIAKASGMNVVQICWGGGNTGVSSQYANFDLSSLATSGNASSRSVVDLGNGWRLCACTTVVTGDMTSLANYVVGGVPSLATGRLATFTGDAINGVVFWMNQLEVGSNYSSPILSGATPVSRPTATASIPANGASAIKLTYSTGETTTVSFNGAPSVNIPSATKPWGTRYITLIEYLP